MRPSPTEKRYHFYLQKAGIVAVWLVLLTGVALRLTIWYQNRNLTLDEANVARNLYERNFAQLCLPLSYEQYAPPVFLWIEKILALIGGFGERTLKFYPLIAGIASLFLFRNILRRYIADYLSWFPLALVALTYLLITYSAVLKQYSPDVMVTLALINLALSVDILSTSTKRFLAIWVAAVTLAVWASMPSAFTIAGVACYYGWVCLEAKTYKKITSIAIFAGIWVAQFAVYYFTILKAQAESKYLQDFHRPYFLYALPLTGAQRAQDINRIKEILQNVAGNGNDIFMKLNFLLICIGAIYLLVKRRKDFLLIVTPIILVLAAAAVNRFTLIDRVILFAQPLWVLLLAIGFRTIFNIRLVIAKILIVAYGVSQVAHTHMFWLFERKYLCNELVPGLEYVDEHKGTGDELYINNGTVPIYLYYTRIHPDKKRWEHFKGTHLLKWEDNYWTIADTMHTKEAFFVYAGGVDKEDLAKRRKDILNVMERIDGLDTFYCVVDHYRRLPGK